MGASDIRARPAVTRLAVLGVVCAVVGTIVAVAAVVVVNGLSASGRIADSHVQNLVAYAATWVPMLAAVIVFVALGSRRGLRPAGSAPPSAAAPGAAATPASGAAPGAAATPTKTVLSGVRGILGLRFHPIDLLWGAAIGIMVRCVASFVNLLIYGTTGLSGQVLLAPIDGWFVFTAAIAPVIIAPVVEELFFRGLMQGSLIAAARSRTDRATAIVLGVGITSIVFTCVHLIGVTNAGQAASIAIPLLLLAGASGTTTALTGRIGGAVIGHVVFNGAAVLLTWPR